MKDIPINSYIDFLIWAQENAFSHWLWNIGFCSCRGNLHLSHSIKPKKWKYRKLKAFRPPNLPHRAAPAGLLSTARVLALAYVWPDYSASPMCNRGLITCGMLWRQWKHMNGCLGLLLDHCSWRRSQTVDSWVHPSTPPARGEEKVLEMEGDCDWMAIKMYLNEKGHRIYKESGNFYASVNLSHINILPWCQLVCLWVWWWRVLRGQVFSLSGFYPAFLCCQKPGSSRQIPVEVKWMAFFPWNWEGKLEGGWVRTL